MPLSSNRINVAELDFDDIKSNLVEFLRGQDQFKDYDFTGSGLSILMDLLAYNTHYNNLYTNLAVNEMFLDSAAKRDSVVSLAKMLGYTPRSATCSYSTVDVQIINPTSNPAVTVLPAGQPFETTVNGIQYTFYNTGDYTCAPGALGYVFSGVKIIEGTPLTYTYTTTPGIRYIIPNANVDVSTIKVTVQETASSGTFTNFQYVNNVYGAIDSTSPIFFVKETDGGLLEIVFGDGNLGMALTNGNVVTIDYYVSSLDAPNGARLFNYSGIPLLGGSTNVSTKVIAAGGSAPEDIESIRFNAPRSFAAQGRAVTTQDYQTIIMSNFPEAKSVAVWGGESNSPAIYGKVFICVLPTDADKLTTTQKTEITGTLLANKNVVSVTPVIVDPDYINIQLDITSYYDQSKTSKSISQLQQILLDTVTNYNNQNLLNFNGVFRFSELSRLLDTSDISFVNNITTVVLNRQVVPQYNVSAQYTINMINPIYTANQPEGNIYSNGFSIYGDSVNTYYLDDDGLGNIRLYTLDSNYQKNIVNPTIGTVDYATGLIVISNLKITSIVNQYFILSVKPASNDVVSALQQVAQIDFTNLNINVIPDLTATGDLAAGYNYVFTPSRP